jgi:hypothetical protein
MVSLKFCTSLVKKYSDPKVLYSGQDDPIKNLFNSIFLSLCQKFSHSGEKHDKKLPYFDGKQIGHSKQMCERKPIIDKLSKIRPVFKII